MDEAGVQEKERAELDIADQDSQTTQDLTEAISKQLHSNSLRTTNADEHHNQRQREIPNHSALGNPGITVTRDYADVQSTTVMQLRLQLEEAQGEKNEA